MLTYSTNSADVSFFALYVVGFYQRTAVSDKRNEETEPSSKEEYINGAGAILRDVTVKLGLLNRTHPSLIFMSIFF